MIQVGGWIGVGGVGVSFKRRQKFVKFVGHFEGVGDFLVVDENAANFLIFLSEPYEVIDVFPALLRIFRLEQ